MTEFLCGLFIGANVTFLLSAMILSGRPGKIRHRSGELVTYQNSRGNIATVELVNDLRSGDAFAVVRKPETLLEFVVAVSSLSS
jgi:hypothetical protein